MVGSLTIVNIIVIYIYKKKKKKDEFMLKDRKVCTYTKKMMVLFIKNFFKINLYKLEIFSGYDVKHYCVMFYFT